MSEEQTLPEIQFYRAAVIPEVKAVNRDKREILHLITNATEDRAGDIVDPAGADVSNYLKNPVVLADHDYRVEKIIGRATALEVRADGLWARTKFHDKGLGADAFNLVADGMARAWSIGFRPVEFDSRRDENGKTMRGFHFKKWELLEYSLVAIPMNPDAVMNAIQRGLVAEENADHLFRGLYPHKADVTTEAPPAEAAGDGSTVERTPRDASLYEEHITRAVERMRRIRVGVALRRIASDRE